MMFTTNIIVVTICIRTLKSSHVLSIQHIMHFCNGKDCSCETTVVVTIYIKHYKALSSSEYDNTSSQSLY